MTDPLIVRDAGVRRPRTGGGGRPMMAAAVAAAIFVAATVALLAVPRGARAADRPSEDQMFGGGAAPSPAPAPTPTPTGGAGGSAASGMGDTSLDPGPVAPLPRGAPPAAAAATAAAPPAHATPAESEAAGSRDVDLLGDPTAAPRLSQEVAPEDPLRIGGQLYLRAAYARPGSTTFSTSDTVPSVTTLRSVTFSAPSLVDAYFDARPNDRVRGFVLGRLFFDPTLPSSSATAAGTGTQMTGVGGNGDTSVPLLSGVSNARGPSVVLDQLWLRFDVGRTVFVTAGRQHVKWGTGRFWTPTDYLHPARRNPVAVFDARPGFTMLKLHFPWEERGWNFYALGLVEGVRRWDVDSNRFTSGSDATETLAQIGGAGRAELVFGPAELGLDIVAYKDRKPRYGADLSFGVGDFDFYVDAGFQYGSEIPRIDPTCPDGVAARSCIYYSVGIKPQVTGGATYSVKYNDNDVFTLAGEYFYNSRGYSDPHVYLALFATETFEFFYTGRHYAALSAILAAPWSWNYTNFTFTTLGNLSDQSFLSRLDYSHTLLTHLSFEAFAAVNYGRPEGEFRLGFTNVMVGGETLSRAPQSISLGLGLRVKI